MQACLESVAGSRDKHLRDIFWILSPLSWVSESFKQDIGQFPFSSDEALQIGRLFYQGHFPCRRDRATSDFPAENLIACLMSGNWKKIKINICPTYFLHFNLESFLLLLKIYFIMKNLTNLRKSVESHT